VRAIVRSAERLPAECIGHRELEVVEAAWLALSEEEVERMLRGCDAVVCCLGHPTNVGGIFGPPRELVTRAARRIVSAVQALQPSPPLKFVLMSSVSVNHPGSLDSRRRMLERAALRAIRALIPPARDNQRAAELLYRQAGASDSHVEWVIVRPDTLTEGEVSGYTVHRTLVSSLFKPDKSSMANVAHFMSELVCDAQVWREWRGQLPVIVDTPSA
jgi:hypothetical protein